MAGKKWIKKAIKRPGALRRAAARSKGGLTKSGKISRAWLNKKTSNKRLQRQKNLAKTLSKLRKK